MRGPQGAQGEKLHTYQTNCFYHNDDLLLLFIKNYFD